MAAMDNLFYRKEKKRFDLALILKRLLKNRRRVALLLIAIPLLVYVLFGNRGVFQRISLHNQKADLEAKIREAEAETEALEARSKALDGDKKAIEKVAREQHGMVKDGERVYKVSPEK